jgi:hypothetical protein
VVYKRDPVSELFDPGASALLARAYARGPGAWTSTRLALPSARHLAWAAGEGINLYAADPTARTRWNRAFIRSVYHLNTWYVRDGRVVGQKRLDRNLQGIRYRVHREGPLHWRIRILLVPGEQDRVPAAQSYALNEDRRRAPDDQLDWAINT